MSQFTTYESAQLVRVMQIVCLICATTITVPGLAMKVLYAPTITNVRKWADIVSLMRKQKQAVQEMIPAPVVKPWVLLFGL